MYLYPERSSRESNNSNTYVHSQELTTATGMRKKTIEKHKAILLSGCSIDVLESERLGLGVWPQLLPWSIAERDVFRLLRSFPIGLVVEDSRPGKTCNSKKLEVAK